MRGGCGERHRTDTRTGARPVCPGGACSGDRRTGVVDAGRGLLRERLLLHSHHRQWDRSGRAFRRPPVRGRGNCRPAGRSLGGESGVRQPGSRGQSASRRTSTGSGLRRGHRRAAVGPSSRPHRIRLWSGHDRRDARPRPRQCRQGGRGQRRVRQGNDRGRATGRRHGRRGDLELCHQPVCRQTEGHDRDVPRSRPGRADRHLRCRRRGRRVAGRTGPARFLRGVHRRCALPGRVPRRPRPSRIHGRERRVHPQRRSQHARGHHQGHQARR